MQVPAVGFKVNAMAVDQQFFHFDLIGPQSPFPTDAVPPELSKRLILQGQSTAKSELR